MGTVRMVDPTALHAPDTPATRPQRACGSASRDVLGLVGSPGGPSPAAVVLVCAPGVVGMS